MGVLSGPQRLFRRVLVLLLVDHLLILLGAYLLLAAAGTSRPGWTGVGASMLLTGIGIEVGVLAWAASLARRAATTGSSSVVVGPATDRGRSLCPTCGWSGPARPRATCPRCHRPTTQVR